MKLEARLEAAAKAMYESAAANLSLDQAWEEASEGGQRLWRERAQTALRAAVPELFLDPPGGIWKPRDKAPPEPA